MHGAGELCNTRLNWRSRNETAIESEVVLFVHGKHLGNNSMNGGNEVMEDITVQVKEIILLGRAPTVERQEKLMLRRKVMEQIK